MIGKGSDPTQKDLPYGYFFTSTMMKGSSRTTPSDGPTNGDQAPVEVRLGMDGVMVDRRPASTPEGETKMTVNDNDK